jgi:LysR family transcriptional regulator of abg operon
MKNILARLRFRHLQLLVGIRRSGSLRSAARELNLSQSAVSKSLKELEGVLGVSLFERNAQGLRLTEQGQRAVDGALLLIAELGHLADELEESSGAAGTILRLGALPYLSPTFIPPLYALLLQRSPGLRLRLREDRVPRLLEELLAGELDALITTYTVDFPDLVAAQRLRTQALFEEKFAVIAPAAHSLARSRKVGWASLVAAPWILPPRSVPLRQLIDQAFMREGLAPPTPLVESISLATNANLVAAGLGVAAVPVSAVASQQRAVRQVELSPAIDNVRVVLVYRIASERHPRIRALQSAIAAMDRPAAA